MFGYRKHSFLRAHALLQILRNNLDDLANLRELQKLLLHEIIRAEGNTKKLKSELKAIKSEDEAARKRLIYLENRIEGFRKSAYIWRSFGDAIAFLYMDKFALKHSFYKTENYNPKQSSGFIVVNESLGRELAVLDSALKHNVPALLVDLTNTIRHGDVCLMGGSDPYLIEVKTSKKLNNRGKKQIQSIEKLRTFYEADKCEELRGMHNVRRQILKIPESSYIKEINECITKAIKNGYAIHQPEAGLHYIVIKTKIQNPTVVLNSLNLINPLVFMLNLVKTERVWSPYL